MEVVVTVLVVVVPVSVTVTVIPSLKASPKKTLIKNPSIRKAMINSFLESLPGITPPTSSNGIPM